MILDFLERLFRSEEQIAYRKTLDKVISGHLVVNDVQCELDYLDKSYSKIRKEYYNVFKELSDKSTLTHQVFSAEEHSNSPKVVFLGNNQNVGFKLEYTRDQSLLTMNYKPKIDHSLLIMGKEKESKLKSENDGGKGYMSVITFYTHPVPDDSGKSLVPKTFILPGDYFTGKITTKPVDDAITHLFETARKRKHIPTPSDEEMKKIPDHEKYILHLLR